MDRNEGTAVGGEGGERACFVILDMSYVNQRERRKEKAEIFDGIDKKNKGKHKQQPGRSSRKAHSQLTAPRPSNIEVS